MPFCDPSFRSKVCSASTAPNGTAAARPNASRHRQLTATLSSPHLKVFGVLNSRCRRSSCIFALKAFFPLPQSHRIKPYRVDTCHQRCPINRVFGFTLTDHGDVQKVDSDQIRGCNNSAANIVQSCKSEYAELMVNCHVLQNLSANRMAVSVRAPVLVISSEFAENSDEQRVKRCSQGTFEALSPAQAATRPGVGNRILDFFFEHILLRLSDFVLKLKSVCSVLLPRANEFFFDRTVPMSGPVSGVTREQALCLVSLLS